MNLVEYGHRHHLFALETPKVEIQNMEGISVTIIWHIGGSSNIRKFVNMRVNEMRSSSLYPIRR